LQKAFQSNEPELVAVIGRRWLKKAIFKSATGTSKQVFFTMLATFPLLPNEHSLGTVDTALDMNCLFEPV